MKHFVLSSKTFLSIYITWNIAFRVYSEEFINISSDDDSAEEHRSNNVPTFTLEDDPVIIFDISFSIYSWKLLILLLELGSYRW